MVNTATSEIHWGQVPWELSPRQLSSKARIDTKKTEYASIASQVQILLGDPKNNNLSLTQVVEQIVGKNRKDINDIVALIGQMEIIQWLKLRRNN